MGIEEESEQVVRAFAEAFSKHDPEALRPFFTDDVVYHNIPMDVIEGADAAVAFLAGFMAMCDRMDIENLHVAVRGNVVLTERIDTFVMGDRVAPLPVMGAFEVRDGRIAAWRDYFDMAQVTKMFDPGA